MSIPCIIFVKGSKQFIGRQIIRFKRIPEVGETHDLILNVKGGGYKVASFKILSVKSPKKEGDLPKITVEIINKPPY